MLLKIAALTASDLDVFARLSELSAEANDWETARKYILRSLGVNPLHPETHRRAAQAAEQLKDHALAIESYQALLLLEPFDTAELHYQLATNYRAQKKLAEARRHALLALEETPRYRAAQKLLLELVALDKPSEKKTESKSQ